MRAWVVAAVVLAAANGVADAQSESVREAVVRGVVARDTSRFFAAYCLAAVPQEVAAATTWEARVKGAWGIESPDAPKSLLARLGDLPHRFVPASGCVKTKGDYDVVLRATGRGPALLVGLGPVQVISSDRAEVVVFTTSGYLTETATAYTAERTREGSWHVVKEEILLQV